MRAARSVAVPAALLLALAACTDGGRQAAPRPWPTSFDCPGVHDPAPTSEQVREVAEEIAAFRDRLTEVGAEIERQISVIEVQGWPALGAEIRQSDFQTPVDEADLTEATDEIRTALQETADLIRTKLSEAIARSLQNHRVPERLQRFADCLTNLALEAGWGRLEP